MRGARVVYLTDESAVEPLKMPIGIRLKARDLGDQTAEFIRRQRSKVPGSHCVANAPPISHQFLSWRSELRRRLVWKMDFGWAYRRFNVVRTFLTTPSFINPRYEWSIFSGLNFQTPAKPTFDWLPSQLLIS